VQQKIFLHKPERKRMVYGKGEIAD